MKLRTKIAGTVALPLALAIASSAQAYTVVDNAEHQLNIGGFVAAQAVWTMDDAADTTNYTMNLGTTRLNVDYRNKEHGTRFLYEQNIGNNTLRHAAIFHDGWVAGQTWSFFANLTGLAETVDATGTAGASAVAPRNAVLGKVIPLGDGMSVGVSAESKGGRDTTDTAAPDLTVNFTGKFGDATVFAAGQQYYKVDAGEDEGFTRLTLGVSVPVGDIGLKAALTQDDKDMAVSVAGQFKISDQLRANLVVEQALNDADDTDYMSIWVNAFYKLPSGWEWGGEVQMVSADDFGGTGTGYSDSDMIVRLQAKYAF